jgi:hypothetical protein
VAALLASFGRIPPLKIGAMAAPVKVQTFVRIRPLNPDEVSQSSPAVKRMGPCDVWAGYLRPAKYEFSAVFDETAKQNEIYKAAVKPLVAKLLLGEFLFSSNISAS